MTQTLITIKSISLKFPHKTCFSDFTCNVRFGDRIAIIGNNGSGKSSLLAMILGDITPEEGVISIANSVRLSKVPQIVFDHSELSGGERFNKALSQALANDPDILLLDEPTNHLDIKNRKSLIGMLKRFRGVIIIATHDEEVLREVAHDIWHLHDGKIQTFKGAYDDYMRENGIQAQSIKDEIAALNRQKKEVHKALMKEQERAKKSNLRGEKSVRENKWPTMVSDEKARRAIETSGKKKLAISDKKGDLLNRLESLRDPEVIKPNFALSNKSKGQGVVLSISSGTIGYDTDLVTDISITIAGAERIAISGNNGSGKSTLIKAIHGEEKLRRAGDWFVPQVADIGYLDQHYSNLDLNSTPADLLKYVRPDWSYSEIRDHLNDFLFRKNEEVSIRIAQLSGGEKARLTLASIAANPPVLLIMDEITNNIDLATKRHIVSVLKSYPGAFILISHEDSFIIEVGIDKRFRIAEGKFIAE